MKHKHFFHFGQTSQCLKYFVTDDPNTIPWPEILYYIINICYLMIVAYHSLLASTEIGWLTSTRAIKRDFYMTGEELPIYFVAVSHYVLAGALTVLVFMGIYSAYNGHKTILYCASGFMLVLILFEGYTAFRIGIRPNECLSNYEELKTALKFHVNNAYKDEDFEHIKDKFIDEETGELVVKPLYRRVYGSYLLISSIQRSLGCCGYNSYIDYLDPTKGVHGIRDPLDGSNPIFTFEVPASCCKRWISKNIFCAAGLPNNTAIVKEKIYTEGCASRILDLCIEIVYSGGRGAAVVTFLHSLLFLLSIPTVVIQVKILNKLASESSYTFSIHNLNQQLEDDEENEERQFKDMNYARKFYHDIDFVLDDETAMFIKELQQEHGIAGEDEIYRNLLLVKKQKIKNKSIIRKSGKFTSPDSNSKGESQSLGQGQHRTIISPIGRTSQTHEQNLPTFALSQEDKNKLKKHGGRFHFFMNKQLLNYAAGVLNASPSSANAETLEDMKQAELVGKMNAFYKQVLDAKRRAEEKRSHSKYYGNVNASLRSKSRMMSGSMSGSRSRAAPTPTPSSRPKSGIVHDPETISMAMSNEKGQGHATVVVKR